MVLEGYSHYLLINILNFHTRWFHMFFPLGQLLNPSQNHPQQVGKGDPSTPRSRSAEFHSRKDQPTSLGFLDKLIKYFLIQSQKSDTSGASDFPPFI